MIYCLSQQAYSRGCCDEANVLKGFVQLLNESLEALITIFNNISYLARTNQKPDAKFLRHYFSLDPVGSSALHHMTDWILIRGNRQTELLRSARPLPRRNQQIFVPCTKTQCFSQLCFHFLRGPRARWRSANCSRVGMNSLRTPAEGEIKLTSGGLRRRKIYGAAVTLTFRREKQRLDHKETPNKTLHRLIRCAIRGRLQLPQKSLRQSRCGS